jgi:hypothetical protein
MSRRADDLPKDDAKQFRAWLGRIEVRWKAKRGESLVGELADAEPPAGRRPLPVRDRDWFMTIKNRRLPLGRKKAIELCLRLRRHGEQINDNVVRMLLIDTTDDPLVIIPSGEATRLRDRIVHGLEQHGVVVNDPACRFLDGYLKRFESLERNFADLREAIRVFRSIHGRIGWWKVIRATNVVDANGTFTTPSLFARLEDETADMQFETRKTKSK